MIRVLCRIRVVSLDFPLLLAVVVVMVMVSEALGEEFGQDILSGLGTSVNLWF